MRKINYQEWVNAQRDYYKNRYDKAIALGINEMSKHFQAFEEIGMRYSALSVAAEVPEILRDRIYTKDATLECRKTIIMIVMMLTEPGEYIFSENGEKEYLPHKVTLNVMDTEAIQAHEGAKEAITRVDQMDFSRGDKDNLYEEYLEDLYRIINWLLIAREKEFPVISGKNLN